MATVTIHSDFGAQDSKVSHCFHCFPIYLPWVMRLDAMIFVFWILSFKPAFSLSSFTFIKRFFSSSSLSAFRVVSSVYLRLLTFLLGILIPAYNNTCSQTIMRITDSENKVTNQHELCKGSSYGHSQYSCVTDDLALGNLFHIFGLLCLVQWVKRSN